MSRYQRSLLIGLPSIAQAANVTVETARGLIASGEIPTSMIGKTVCAKPRAVRQWRSQRYKPQPAT